MTNKNKILITGANFANKGAQAMLFVTVDSIRKAVPDVDIYFATEEKNIDTSNYSINQMFVNRDSLDYELGLASKKRIKTHHAIKTLAKRILKKPVNVRTNEYFDLHNSINTFSLIIDISGYQLGSKWNYNTIDRYLKYIEVSKKNNIPILLLPQSFGPFDLDSDLLNRISQDLQYPDLVFAREKEGFDYLRSSFKLDNVYLSNDLVLQNNDISYQNIFKKIPDFNLPNISPARSIAIVPNQQCLNHGDEDAILDMYTKLIEKELNKGRRIYLIRHSDQDFDICNKIKDKFRNDERVELISNNLSCLEYDLIVRNFEYIICSRYHGCVHAYKNKVPCILLGWELKYKELAYSLNQGQFVYRIDGSLNSSTVNEILDGLELMDRTFSKQSKIIGESLKEIQNNNVFDKIDFGKYLQI